MFFTQSIMFGFRGILLFSQLNSVNITDEDRSLKSRIPRPSVNPFGRLQVLSILSSDKNKEKSQPASDSLQNSPKSTPERVCVEIMFMDNNVLF